MEIEYRHCKDCELEGSAVVIGFPSLGLVSSIATNFLSRELKMDLVGGFTSPQFPPYCILQNGEPMPQIRIFSGARETDPDNPGVAECCRVTHLRRTIPKHIWQTCRRAYNQIGQRTTLMPGISLSTLQ